jgi:hypothetical protein
MTIKAKVEQMMMITFPQKLNSGTAHRILWFLLSSTRNEKMKIQELHYFVHVCDDFCKTVDGTTETEPEMRQTT